MKLTVLKWFWERMLVLLGRTIEIIFRSLLCLMPLGLYLLIIQNRQKASSISSISVYTNEKSKFQHVFPGFLLVSINPDGLSEFINKNNTNLQNFIQRNKYTLSLLFMSVIVGLMILSYIRGGN